VIKIFVNLFLITLKKITGYVIFLGVIFFLVTVKKITLLGPHYIKDLKGRIIRDIHFAYYYPKTLFNKNFHLIFISTYFPCNFSDARPVSKKGCLFIKTYNFKPMGRKVTLQQNLANQQNTNKSTGGTN